jgi:hypothetical protein
MESVEPFEVRIAGATVLVEIDDPDRPNWKGAVVEGAALDQGEVTVSLSGPDGERTSRARVVTTGPYEPPVLEGLEAFH